jgi:hypothetical protein
VSLSLAKPKTKKHKNTLVLLVSLEWGLKEILLNSANLKGKLGINSLSKGV